MKAESGNAACEIAGSPGAFPVATGSLPVASAEALCRRWEKLSDDNWNFARTKSVIYSECAKELRRELAAASVRQPEENKNDVPTLAAGTPNPSTTLKS